MGKIMMSGIVPQLTVPAPFPSDYTKVEYIESSGTQYIDTGVLCADDMALEITWADTSAYSSKSLFGCGHDNTKGYFVVFQNSLYVGQGKIADLDISALNVKHTLRVETTAAGILTYTLDGTSTTAAYTPSLDQLYTIHLLNQNPYTRYRSAKLYSARIWKNGTLVRDFVPCANADNEVGLYDLREQKFYTNAGSGRFTAPGIELSGVPAGELTVGQSVYLNENGALAEYIVVNQGIPSNSTLYDSSCNGTWVMRKDIYKISCWDNQASTAGFGNCYSMTNSNGAMKLHAAALGSDVKVVIKQIKIPYMPAAGSSTINTGANGLSVTNFLLSLAEVGFTNFGDGAPCSYFEKASATNVGSSTRIAYYNGTKTEWWTRTVGTYPSGYTQVIFTDGMASTRNMSEQYTYGFRPAVVLDSATLFNPDTMTLA